MIEDNQKLLRRSVAALVLITVLWVGYLIYHALSLPALVVTTPNASDYVTITPIKDGKLDRPSYKIAQHKLTLRVNAGDYEIAANNSTSTTSKTVSIKSWQRLSFSLTPLVAVSPEPVYGNSVSGAFADGSHIIFIDDTLSGALSSIDSSNTVGLLAQSKSLHDAKWANSSLGLAHDDNNNLFLINNGALSQVNLPFVVPAGSPSFSYDITPAGQIYVSQGTDLYRGAVGNNLTKIYSSSGRLFELSAGHNNVSAIESPKNAPDPGGSLVIISDSGQVRHTHIDATIASQSPDGKYLAAVSDNGLAIYGTSSLNKVSSIASDAINSYGWGMGDNLYYNQKESLWLLNIGSGQSSKLAIAPGKENILGIYPASDGSYVYFSAASANTNAGSGDSQLFRVKTSSQPSSSAIVGLSAFLPDTFNGPTGNCSLNYVNFSSANITIHYPGVPSAISQNNCYGVAQNLIEQYGLAPGDFKYQFFADGE